MRLPVRIIASLTALLLGACSAIADDLGRALPGADPQPVRLVVWSSRPLPPSLLPRARAIPGVVAGGERLTGLVNLAAVHGGEEPLPSRPRGAILPISVEAHDPGVLAALDAPDHAVEALRRGDAVVTQAEAALRGVSVGDGFDLGSGAHRARVRIGAIVGDDVGFRSEVVVPLSVAAALGLGRAESVVLAVDPDAVAQTEGSITQLLGNFPARIRGGEADRGRGGRLLSLAEIKSLFGEFWYRPSGGRRIAIDPAWVDENIVRARVPLLGTVHCHRRIVPYLTAAMEQLIAEGLGDLVETYDGCYNPRMQVSDDAALSRHAYGIAFDINAPTNGYGSTPRQDPRLVEIIEGHGFSWGGRWTVPDGMHFEFAGRA